MIDKFVIWLTSLNIPLLNWVIEHFAYIITFMFFVTLIWHFISKSKDKKYYKELESVSSSNLDLDQESSSIEYLKADEIPAPKMSTARRVDVNVPKGEIKVKNAPHSNVVNAKLPPFDPNKHVVLVIDDQQVMLEKIARSVLKNKYNLVFAKSVDEAIRKIEFKKPAVIVSDIDMDEKSGIDLVKFLKSTVRYANIPVILMTSNMNYYYKDLLALGVKGYLSKPFDIKLLEDQINYLINQD